MVWLNEWYMENYLVKHGPWAYISHDRLSILDFLLTKDIVDGVVSNLIVIIVSILLKILYWSYVTTPVFLLLWKYLINPAKAIEFYLFKLNQWISRSLIDHF